MIDPVTGSIGVLAILKHQRDEPGQCGHECRSRIPPRRHYEPGITKQVDKGAPKETPRQSWPSPLHIKLLVGRIRPCHRAVETRHEHRYRHRLTAAAYAKPAARLGGRTTARCAPYAERRSLTCIRASSSSGRSAPYNDRHLTLSALDKALKRRCPDAGLLHRSDQGCTYASEDYRTRLARRDVTCSMSRRGNCYDNAVAESFFSTVKSEAGDRFDSYAQAKEALFDYIELFYNQRRRHSTLGQSVPRSSNGGRPRPPQSIRPRDRINPRAAVTVRGPDGRANPSPARRLKELARLKATLTDDLQRQRETWLHVYGWERSQAAHRAMR